MSAVRCWQGLHPPAQAVSGRVNLHSIKLGEVLVFRCEEDTTHYSDVTLTTQPQIYCKDIPHGASNNDPASITWLCQITENTNVTIVGFNNNHETLIEFDVRAHDLEEALRGTPAPCTPSPPLPEPTTASPSINPNIARINQNNEPSTDEPTTTKQVITTAREYPLYVVLCALFIPLILVGGVVILLIVVVVKCSRKKKVLGDPESVEIDDYSNGGANASTEAQGEADQTLSSNQGDTSLDILNT